MRVRHIASANFRYPKKMAHFFNALTLIMDEGKTI